MNARWRAAYPLVLDAVLERFSGFEPCADQPQSWYDYGPADALENRPWSMSASSGF